MRKGKVFFHPIEGSGALTISWSSEPKGDAVEAQKGDGVGFFSDSGKLTCVIFDEVVASQDRQSLKFKHHCVEVEVNKGKVTHSVIDTSAKTPKPKKVLKPKRRARQRRK